MTFAEYQSNVLDFYLKEQAAGRLFFASPYPTPAKLKTGCLRALETRYDRKDEFFLRSYFNMVNSLDFGAAVRKFETDKFRPLNSYLRDPARNPSAEHIELLAWLVNYPDRPYKSSYEITYDSPLHVIKDGENQSTNDGEDISMGLDATSKVPPIVQYDVEEFTKPSEHLELDENEDKAVAPSINRPREFFSTRKTFYVIGTALLLSTVFFFWLMNNPIYDAESGVVIPVIGQKGCVIWKGDQYEPASCKYQSNGLGSFGIDIETVKNLRRIISPDTITPKSIKKIWYVKIDGHFEYYTTAGFHPIHTEMRLKPLTRYIYNKYLYRYDEKTGRDAGIFSWFKRPASL